MAMRTLAVIITTLLLATGTAQALPIAEWQCGDITVNITTPRGADHTTVTITGPAGFTFNKGRVGHNFHFRFSAEATEKGGFKSVEMEGGDFRGYTGGKVYLNGKRCKDYVYDEPKSGE